MATSAPCWRTSTEEALALLAAAATSEAFDPRTAVFRFGLLHGRVSHWCAISASGDQSAPPAFIVTINSAARMIGYVELRRDPTEAPPPEVEAAFLAAYESAISQLLSADATGPWQFEAPLEYDVSVRSLVHRMIDVSTHEVKPWVQMRNMVHDVRTPIDADTAGCTPIDDSVDVSSLVALARGFETELNIHGVTDAGRMRLLQDNMNRGVVWRTETGEAVSMALATRMLPDGVSVSHVYTDPSHRGKGLARKVVAALTQRLHCVEGKPWVQLFVDVDNATTNKLYRSVGFEYVACSTIQTYHVTPRVTV